MSRPTAYDIHQITEPDPRYLEQFHPLITEMVSEGAALGWIDPPSRPDVGELLGDLVQASERDDACLVVAERADEGEHTLVGFAYWTRREGETEQPHADVGRVAVSSHARGGGLGRRLVEALVEGASRVGIEILTLDVRGNNHAAMHLYERLGFCEYGRLADFVAIDNERWDNVYYSLDLRDEEHQDLLRHGDAPRGPGASVRP